MIWFDLIFLSFVRDHCPGPRLKIKITPLNLKTCSDSHTNTAHNCLCDDTTEGVGISCGASECTGDFPRGARRLVRKSSARGRLSGRGGDRPPPGGGRGIKEREERWETWKGSQSCVCWSSVALQTRASPPKASPVIWHVRASQWITNGAQCLIIGTCLFEFTRLFPEEGGRGHG